MQRCRQRHQRLSTARSGNEFHVDRVFRVHLHHGADVAGLQSMTRHVDLQNHGIEFMKTHEFVLGVISFPVEVMWLIAIETACIPKAHGERR